MTGPAAADESAVPLEDGEARAIARLAHRVGDEVATVVEGKDDVVALTLLVLLAGGHLLIGDAAAPRAGADRLQRVLRQPPRRGRRGPVSSRTWPRSGRPHR